MAAGDREAAGRTTLCFLRRGAEGNDYKGMLDNVVVYSVPPDE